MDVNNGAAPAMAGSARGKLRLMPVPVAATVIPGWAARVAKWAAA